MEYKALKYITLSLAEAKMADIFYNAQVAIPIRHILESLNYP